MKEKNRSWCHTTQTEQQCTLGCHRKLIGSAMGHFKLQEETTRSNICGIPCRLPQSSCWNLFNKLLNVYLPEECFEENN